MAKFLEVNTTEPYNTITINLDCIATISRLRDGKARLDIKDKRIHTLTSSYDYITAKIKEIND